MYRFTTSNTPLHECTESKVVYPFPFILFSLSHNSVRLNIMRIFHEETEAQR